MQPARLIRLLGAAHVELDGRPAAELPGRAFALLALLKFEYDEVADRSALASRLWEDSPATQAIVDSLPVKRMGRPEEVVSALAFFAGEDAGFTTGQVLYVCGGLTLARAPI